MTIMGRPRNAPGTWQRVLTRRLVGATVGAAVAASCAAADYVLRRGLVPPSAPYPEGSEFADRVISARQAVRFAVRALRQRGVGDITICELRWIEAGVGAVVLDATGVLRRGEVRFDAFQIGIRDGTERQAGQPAGRELFFLARGADQAGARVWDPLPTAEELLLFGNYQFADRRQLEAAVATCR